MKYLLDTNVISELARQEPEPQVAAFFGAIPVEELHLSVLTLGEIRRGIERLPVGAKRKRFSRWLELELPSRFEGRLLAVDQQVADAWGRLGARGRRTLPAVDSLIAATAIAHGLQLLTRNLKDFEGTGLQASNPWA